MCVCGGGVRGCLKKKKNYETLLLENVRKHCRE